MLQVAEEIAREQEGGPGLCAIELGIAVPQDDPIDLFSFPMPTK